MDESGLNLTIRDQPIFEDEDQAKQAMDDMASTLRLVCDLELFHTMLTSQRAQQSGVRRNAGTIRGRRDVRNTVFVPDQPSGQSDLPSQPADVTIPTSPIPPAKHAMSPSMADERAMSDTTSIRSGHALNSLSGAVVHPELADPGLNASIIETVSAWFSEGAVTKSFVVGELALAHNSIPNIGSTRIRLDNFQVLEKVAANPHFVSELPAQDQSQAEDRRGEYDIQLSGITRPAPIVAFKYQVHMDQTNASAYCPVIFRPVWNLEEYQASAIVFYTLNPAFTSTVPVDSLVLKNLVLTVNLDTTPEEDESNTTQPREVAHATGAVMHPNTGASFRRKTSAVTWKLPELEIKPGSDDKFLVRFSTTTPGPRKGKFEGRFELPTAQTGARLGISAVTDTPETPQEGASSDPFADGQTADEQHPSAVEWKEVPTVRKLVAGKYVSC